ncbi:Uncharacterised protein [Serratia proteamaculans]|nr:Uncharacterised protein [Serratia proteamaculans]
MGKNEDRRAGLFRSALPHLKRTSRPKRAADHKFTKLI